LKPELTQLREVIRAQQRTPARLATVGRRIAAQVAGVQQVRKIERPPRYGREFRLVPQDLASRFVSRCWLSPTPARINAPASTMLSVTRSPSSSHAQITPNNGIR
jgi:hypothetical protein